MRFRVERTRTDTGYGEGWVVLDEYGDLCAEGSTWLWAMTAAWFLVAHWSVV